MKLPLAIGVAAAATLAAAYAQPMIAHTLIERDGFAPHDTIDANQDGWITRAEASAAFERIFASLDDDGDGRLNATDRQRHIEMRRHGPDSPGRHHGRHGMDGDCTRTVEPADAGPGEEQRIAVVCEREAEGQGGEHAIERRVVIHGGPGGHGPHRGGGGPPMFMMLIANSEEADTNGDGALSLEEFRAQHLRFFDASDANGDGRIRFEPPPVPSEPPAAPEPPAPPAPPR